MSKHRAKWADAVTKAVGAKPGDFSGRGVDSSHAKAVWYGLMDEYQPKITLIEMAKFAGDVGDTHTTAWSAIRRWRDLPWQERYGWLLLADSLYGSSNRRGQWIVSDIADQSLFDAAEWRRKHREKANPKPKKISIPGHYDER
jgi:hypothetical protein